MSSSPHILGLENKLGTPGVLTACCAVATAQNLGQEYQLPAGMSLMTH